MRESIQIPIINDFKDEGEAIRGALHQAKSFTARLRKNSDLIVITARTSAHDHSPKRMPNPSVKA